MSKKTQQVSDIAALVTTLVAAIAWAVAGNLWAAIGFGCATVSNLRNAEVSASR
jgi:hypothetical protein